MLSFRQTAARDVPQLSDLWLACFEDTPQAVKLFFERNKSDLHGYAATEDGAVIAAVYLIDCTLNGRQAHYLCGAATLPSHRKRGVMSALIDYALGDAAARGDSFSVLLPANDGLYRFYARLGYQKGCTAHALTLDCACDEDAASGNRPISLAGIAVPISMNLHTRKKSQVMAHDFRKKPISYSLPAIPG